MTGLSVYFSSGPVHGCLQVAPANTTELQDTQQPYPPTVKIGHLQYNTLARWFPGTNDSSTKCLMFQALFFYNSLKLKTLFFFFVKS